MTLVPGDYLWCRCSVQYFLVCYEEKIIKSTDMLASLKVQSRFHDPD